MTLINEGNHPKPIWNEKAISKFWNHVDTPEEIEARNKVHRQFLLDKASEARYRAENYEIEADLYK